MQQNVVQNDQEMAIATTASEAPNPIVPVNKENVAPENALIPFEPVFNENQEDPTNVPVPVQLTAPPVPVTLQQPMAHQNNSQVVTNQLRQAPVMFQGATFQNCTINLNVPQ